MRVFRPGVGLCIKFFLVLILHYKLSKDIKYSLQVKVQCWKKNLLLLAWRLSFTNANLYARGLAATTFCQWPIIPYGTANTADKSGGGRPTHERLIHTRSEAAAQCCPTTRQKAALFCRQFGVSSVLLHVDTAQKQPHPTLSREHEFGWLRNRLFQTCII